MSTSNTPGLVTQVQNRINKEKGFKDKVDKSKVVEGDSNMNSTSGDPVKEVDPKTDTNVLKKFDPKTGTNVVKKTDHDTNTNTIKETGHSTDTDTTDKTGHDAVSISKKDNKVEVSEMETADVTKIVNEALEGKEFNKKMNEAAEFAKKGVEGINSVKSDINNLKENMGNISKASGEACSGIECLKDDFSSIQKSHSDVNIAIDDINSRLDNLKERKFMCDQCGAVNVEALSSFCSNCGAKIHEWTNKDGNPVPGWKPYWEREHTRQD